MAKGSGFENHTVELLRYEYDYICLWRDVPEKILFAHGIINVDDYEEYSKLRKDIGIDVVAIKDGKLTFIQCKNYEDNVYVKHLGGFLLFILAHNASGMICYSNNISSFIKNTINKNNDKMLLKITLRQIPFDNQIIFHPKTQENLVPRKYQLDAIKQLSNKNHKKVGLFAPCGLGKTYISGMIGKKYDNVIVLSPLRQLTSNTLDSMSRILGKEYHKILISSDGMRDVDTITENINPKNVIGCTYDSVDVLIKIIDNLQNVCLIVDECHNLTQNNLTNNHNDMYKILNKDIKIIYVSATPKPGYKYDDVYLYKWERAIEEEHICDFDITIPQKEVIDDINLNKMLELLKDIADINEKVIKKGYFLIKSLLFNGNKKCIVYLTTIAKAKLFENVITGLMKLLNVEFEIHTITNKTSKNNRENSIYRFKHNTILTIILNVHILDEGIDIPECDSVYITQPNDNIDNLIQRMCRCNRITSTKKKCNMYIWTTETKTKKIMDYIKDNTYDKISEKINMYNPIKNSIICNKKDSTQNVMEKKNQPTKTSKNQPTKTKKEVRYTKNIDEKSERMTKKITKNAATFEEVEESEISENEQSDNEQSDNEQSDNEQSDNEQSDNEPTDNEKSEKKIEAENTKGFRGYDFRVNVIRPSNKDKIESGTVKKILKKMCSRWVFQTEKGEKNGYLHYQGRVQLFKKTIKKTALNQFVKLFDMPVGDVFQYFRPTTKGVHKTKNFNYVLKEQTRVEGPWTEKDYIEPVEVWIPEHLRFLNINTMRPFQKKVYEMALVRLDARTIIWIYNKNGGAGKSTISEYIDLHGGISIDYMGDPEKILQSLCNITMTKNIRDVKGIVIDIPKSMYINDDFYVTIEIIKKGKFVDMRNKYKEWRINPPPVIIFSNRLPDIKTLSADRWKIYTINDDMDLEVFDIKEEMKKEEKKKDKKMKRML